MPIYEYACQDCAHEFELLQPIRTPAPAACPACGAGHVRKRISATSFVLKGSGWYRDHYGLKRSASNSETKDGSGRTPSTPTSSTPTSSTTTEPTPAKSADKAGSPSAGEQAAKAAK